MDKTFPLEEFEITAADKQSPFRVEILEAWNEFVKKKREEASS